MMADNNPTNGNEVIARIRERVRARHAGEPEQSAPRFDASAAFIAPTAAAQYDWQELYTNLAACNASHSAVGTLNPRPPGLHNKIIQFAKRVMRRALTWYTRPLHEFHGAVTRTLNQTTIALQDVRTAIGILEARIESYKTSLQSQIETLRARTEDLERTSATHSEAIRALQRDARRLGDQLQRGHIERIPVTQPVALSSGEQSTELDFDYFMFEERFRGSEEEIKRRQAAYLGYFEGRTDVLDLGCGRGEFLELLRDRGIDARGVEIGKDALLLCREKGLAVVEANLLSFLQSLEDEAAGGIFCSQVIEHLPTAAQINLVKLAYKKLRPGSPVIIETINPECLYALCRNFYLDPTHVRPVHPETLAFTMRSVGLNNVEIKYSSPMTDRQVPPLELPQVASEVEAFNRGIKNINDLLFGNQDYAALGWR